MSPPCSEMCEQGIAKVSVRRLAQLPGPREPGAHDEAKAPGEEHPEALRDEATVAEATDPRRARATARAQARQPEAPERVNAAVSAAAAVRERLAAARSEGVSFGDAWPLAIEQALADLPEPDEVAEHCQADPNDERGGDDREDDHRRVLALADLSSDGVRGGGEDARPEQKEAADPSEYDPPESHQTDPRGCVRPLMLASDRGSSPRQPYSL